MTKLEELKSAYFGAARDARAAADAAWDAYTAYHTAAAEEEAAYNAELKKTQEENTQ